MRCRRQAFWKSLTVGAAQVSLPGALPPSCSAERLGSAVDARAPPKRGDLHDRCAKESDGFAMGSEKMPHKKALSGDGAIE